MAISVQRGDIRRERRLFSHKPGWSKWLKRKWNKKRRREERELARRTLMETE